jgi:hypothetical protein
VNGERGFASTSHTAPLCDTYIVAGAKVATTEIFGA